MTRNVVRPANCGAATSQPSCWHADAGIGSGGLAQCAPPSRDARTAPVSPAGQSPVIHPVPAGLTATPVLPQATGSPLPLGSAPFTDALRAASVHVRPLSDDRYKRTGFCPRAAPMLSSNHPRPSAKATATGSAAATEADRHQVRPPSAVP